jgi:hypothetical protein
VECTGPSAPDIFKIEIEIQIEIDFHDNAGREAAFHHPVSLNNLSGITGVSLSTRGSLPVDFDFDFDGKRKRGGGVVIGLAKDACLWAYSGLQVHGVHPHMRS